MLPQKAEAGSEWAALFSPEQQAHWVHRLANLALLSGKKNSAAGAMPFRQKKERYLGVAVGYTNLPLTDSILRQGEAGWGAGRLGQFYGLRQQTLPTAIDCARHSCRCAEAWTPAVLEQRQKTVLDMARSCWQLHARPLH